MIAESPSLDVGGLRVLIVSPFGADSARGNATTASRLARRLAWVGARATFVNAQRPGALARALEDEPPDVLLGVHAGHFARALAEVGFELYRSPATMPTIVLAIGGNELYEDLGVAPSATDEGHLRPASLDLFERADAVLVATHHQLEATRARHPERVFLVPRYPEVGHGPIEGLAAALERLPPGPTLTWDGALRPQKRPEWILPVLERVRLAHPRTRLLLAGPPPSDAAGKGLERELLAAGAVLRVPAFAPGPTGSVGTLLAQTDITLNTSRSEGMSNFLLESMHAGVPVVAADCAGTTSWIEQQARLFSSVDEAAERICELIESPTAAGELAATARAWLQQWASPAREADALAAALLEARKHAGARRG